MQMKPVDGNICTFLCLYVNVRLHLGTTFTHAHMIFGFVSSIGLDIVTIDPENNQRARIEGCRLNMVWKNQPFGSESI